MLCAVALRRSESFSFHLCVSCMYFLQLYKNLWTAVLQESKALERASWWAEFAVHKPVVGRLKAKL